ncbi:MAG TPA: TonB C-terminal domain-containing protein [Candidatus Sulfotelmatobacter sp.]|nr:TonB C-terminal domain-containing protein [Candidatus Sulfotelmatobacter sp.]
MNRLQKKCVISTAAIHLLMLTILIFGPAFFNREPKTDNTVLDVIPSTVLDNALNTGVRDAQAPQPTPAVIPPSFLRPPPLTPPPTPEPKVVQPPQPAPTPSPSLLQAFKDYFSRTKPAPTVTPDMKPVEHSEKTHDDNIKVDLSHRIKRTDIPKHTTSENTFNTKELDSELNILKKTLSSGTKIDMPGNGSEASASYDAVLRSIYLQAVVANLPAQVAHNDEHTLVKVTIARDGTVLSSTITSPSGDSAWDNAVQRTLNQVTSVHAFPDSWTEQQRTFSLDFNPQVAKELQ